MLKRTVIVQARLTATDADKYRDLFKIPQGPHNWSDLIRMLLEDYYLEAIDGRLITAYDAPKDTEPLPLFAKKKKQTKKMTTKKTAKVKRKRVA